MSILSLIMILACSSLPGCFEPEPEPPVKYTVTFNQNYTGAPAATTMQVESGQKVQKPADPTRSDYTFDGWFDNASGTGTAFDFNTVITANKTLYAKWSQVTYTVTFNYNYTGAPAAITQQVASGGTVQKPTDPTRNEYTFNGWFSAASGGTAVTFPLTITAATTLYAQWTQSGGTTPVNPNPPSPTTGLPDNHQGTEAEDAAWNRYDLYALIKNTTSTVVAENSQSYMVAVNGVGGTEGAQGSAINIPGSNRANSEGYLPVGNLNRNTNATITYTIDVSAAAKVGIYGQFSDRATSDPLIKFSDIFSLTVNGAVQTVTTNLPQGGSNYATTNKYIFLGFVNLSQGTNTVVLTVTMPNANNNGYNFYGFRFTAQSATITGKAPA